MILTATSFWVANTSLLWAPGVPLGLAVLAIAQMGVHLVFFLHITTGPDNTNNVLALAFGMLIVILVVAGSLWIMTNLNDNMMPIGRADEYAYAALSGLEDGGSLVAAGPPLRSRDRDGTGASFVCSVLARGRRTDGHQRRNCRAADYAESAFA